MSQDDIMPEPLRRESVGEPELVAAHLLELDEALKPLGDAFHDSKLDVQKFKVRKIAQDIQILLKRILQQVLDQMKLGSAYLLEQNERPRAVDLCQGVKDRAIPALLKAARIADKPFRNALTKIMNTLSLSFDCLIFGAIKDIDGISRKHTEPETEKVPVFDLNRATIIFKNENELKNLLQQLSFYFTIVYSLNKFKTQWTNASEPPCLHLNLTLLEPSVELAELMEPDGIWVFELQLTLKEFYEIKQRWHPVYKILRVEEQLPLPRACPVCALFRKFLVFKDITLLPDFASGQGIRKGKWEGVDVAYKAIASNSGEVKQALPLFLKEVRFLTRLNHENVVKILGIVNDIENLGFLTEWAPGNLTRYLNEGNLDLNEKFAIAFQICDALIYLHQHAVVHNDLKSANVLYTLDESKKVRVQLCDFGLSEDLKSISKGKGCGSAAFKSPEAWGVTSQGCKSKADVYGYGCLLIEIFAQTQKSRYLRPWRQFNDVEIEAKVKNKELPPELQCINRKGLREIVGHFLRFEAGERPSMQEARNELEAFKQRLDLAAPRLELESNFSQLDYGVSSTLNIKLLAGKDAIDLGSPTISWSRNSRILDDATTSSLVLKGCVADFGLYNVTVFYEAKQESFVSNTILVNPNPQSWRQAELRADEAMTYQLMTKMRVDVPIFMDILCEPHKLNVLTCYDSNNSQERKQICQIYFPDDYSIQDDQHVMIFKQMDPAMMFVFGKIPGKELGHEVTAFDAALDLHFIAKQKFEYCSKPTKKLLFRKLAPWKSIPDDENALTQEIKKLLAQARNLERATTIRKVPWKSVPGPHQQEPHLFLTNSHLGGENIIDTPFMQGSRISSLGLAAGITAGAAVLESVCRNVVRCRNEEDFSRTDCAIHIVQESAVNIIIGGASFGTAAGLLSVGLRVATVTPITALIVWAGTSIAYMLLSNKPWSEKLARCGIQAFGTSVAIGGAAAAIAVLGVSNPVGWAALLICALGWVVGYGITKVLDYFADNYFESQAEFNEVFVARKILGLTLVASEENVRDRFKELELLLHPDHGNSSADTHPWIDQIRAAKYRMQKYIKKRDRQNAKRGVGKSEERKQESNSSKQVAVDVNAMD